MTQASNASRNTRKPNIDVDEIIHELEAIDHRRKRRRQVAYRAGGLAALAFLIGSSAIIVNGNGTGRGTNITRASTVAETPNASATRNSETPTIATSARPPQSGLDTTVDTSGTLLGASASTVATALAPGATVTVGAPSRTFSIGVDSSIGVDINDDAATDIVTEVESAADVTSNSNGGNTGDSGDSNGSGGNNGGSSGGNGSGGTGGSGGSGGSGGNNGSGGSDGDTGGSDGAGNTTGGGINLGLDASHGALGVDIGTGDSTLGVTAATTNGGISLDFSGRGASGGAVDLNIGANDQGEATTGLNVVGIQGKERSIGAGINGDNGLIEETGNLQTVDNIANSANGVVGNLLGGGSNDSGGLLDVSAGDNGLNVGGNGVELQSSPQTEDLIEIDLGGLF